MAKKTEKPYQFQPHPTTRRLVACGQDGKPLEKKPRGNQPATPRKGERPGA